MTSDGNRFFKGMDESKLYPLLQKMLERVEELERRLDVIEEANQLILRLPGRKVKDE